MNKSSILLLTPLLLISQPHLAEASDTFPTKGNDVTAVNTAIGAQDNSPIALEISGHFKMYGNYAHQDGDVRPFDILRDTDITFAGETTFSNGLTVGALINADGDGGDDFEVEDSYMFLSGQWGRFSFGMEDGAAFILQVSAPSADDNIDGIETFVNPINFSATSIAGTNFETEISEFGLDYDNDLTAGADKISYYTPLLSGLQAGVSYTADMADFSPVSRGANGNSPNNILDEFGSAWEMGLRYEGKLSDNIHYITGGGYTLVNVEKTNNLSTVDTYHEWNIGLDFDIGDFGIGAIYTENNGGAKVGNDSLTYVIGADYTVGPVKYGASWLHNQHEESATEDIKVNRLAAGLIYEYGAGLSFRGTVSHVMTDVPTSIGSDVDGTAITFGTQILF